MPVFAGIEAGTCPSLTDSLRMVNGVGVEIRKEPGKRCMSELFSDTKNRAALVFLLGLIAVALYFCYVLIAPFLRPIIFSAVLAILFYPLHSRIVRRVRNRNLSAFLSMCVVILFIVLSTVTAVRLSYRVLAASSSRAIG